MVRELAQALARQGIEAHVATTNDNGPEMSTRRARPGVQDGVTYWYFPGQTRFYTISWPLAVWLGRHVSEFDVVHIHALFSFSTLPPRSGLSAAVPYIVRPSGR